MACCPYVCKASVFKDASPLMSHIVWAWPNPHEAEGLGTCVYQSCSGGKLVVIATPPKRTQFAAIASQQDLNRFNCKLWLNSESASRP